jgi:AcrR family transcriptional regulator
MQMAAGVTRSRDAESAATRRVILDAAEALLAAHGEGGLSIRELCARAGVTAPTVYHHFGDKAALVQRVVDECFADFDRTFAGRAAPNDPVEALRWAFDRYVEYGRRHPAHYRVMFQPRRAHPTPGGRASYDGLRRGVAKIAAAGRLVPSVEDAAAAFWATVHGVTSLVVSSFLPGDAPVAALVRDAMIAQLTTSAPARRVGAPESKRRKRS